MMKRILGDPIIRVWTHFSKIMSFMLVWLTISHGALRRCTKTYQLFWQVHLFGSYSYDRNAVLIKIDFIWLITVVDHVLGSFLMKGNLEKVSPTSR